MITSSQSFSHISCEFSQLVVKKFYKNKQIWKSSDITKKNNSIKPYLFK